MHGLRFLYGAAALLIGASVVPAANAAPEKILPSEPAKGQLRSGDCVLVDDGSCEKGKIKRVCTGSGRNPDGTRSDAPAVPRTRSCVERPK
jgi:hypothetical protein